MNRPIRHASALGIVFLALATASAPAQFQTDFKRTVGEGAGAGLAAGDFTGDGLPDVAYADQQEPADLRLVRNEGLGEPGHAVTVLAGEVVGKWLLAHDVDADGDLDLVFGTRPEPSTAPPPPFPPDPGTLAPTGRIGVALNDGTGAFTLVRSPLPFDDNGSAAGLGAADQDAHADLFVLTSAGISVLLGDGAGAFAHHADFPKTDPALAPAVGPGQLLFDQTAGLAVGDYDNDGDDDAAVVNHGFAVFDPLTLFTFTVLDRIGIHDNDGAGNLAPGSSFATGHGATGLLARDLDGNGWDDLAAVVPGDSQDGTDPGRLEVHLAGASGFAHATYTADVNPFRAVAGDFDGDGLADLATIGFSTAWVFDPLDPFTPPPGWQQQLTVLPGDGNGTFHQAPIVSPCRSHRFPVVADFDGDGLDDLAVTTHETAPIPYVRYLMSGPRQFIRYPGTGEDLQLASALGTDPPTGSPPDDEKFAGLGDVITLEVSSPNGTFAGAPTFAIVGQVPVDPVVLTFTGYEKLFFFGLFVDVLPMAPVSGPGAAGATVLSVPLVAPPLSGKTFFIQVAVLSPLASNGLYAATDLHTVSIE